VAAHVVVEDPPDPADLALLEERVAAAAVAATGAADEQEFGIFVRGPAGELTAGISGIVAGGGCELTALWVEEADRGRGIARALLAAAEAEARRRGCAHVTFHTYDVLTHRLFERLGYRTAGVIDGAFAGTAVRWYHKELSTDHNTRSTGGRP